MQTIKIGNFDIKFEINNNNYITISSNNFIYNIDDNGKFYNYNEIHTNKPNEEKIVNNWDNGFYTKDKFLNNWSNFTSDGDNGLTNYITDDNSINKKDDIETNKEKMFYADTSDEPWKKMENNFELQKNNETKVMPKKVTKRVSSVKKKV